MKSEIFRCILLSWSLGPCLVPHFVFWLAPTCFLCPPYLLCVYCLSLTPVLWLVLPHSVVSLEFCLLSFTPGSTSVFLKRLWHQSLSAVCGTPGQYLPAAQDYITSRQFQSQWQSPTVLLITNVYDTHRSCNVVIALHSRKIPGCWGVHKAFIKHVFRQSLESMQCSDVRAELLPLIFFHLWKHWNTV